MLDKRRYLWHNRLINKELVIIKIVPLGRNGSKMENITVGSQFTTAKSGVSGVVQEIIKNPSGTFRVRLDVNGQDRWTTVTK